MSQAIVSALLGLALSVCAAPPGDPERAAWTGEWNARVASAASDFEHPCATRPFIAWADGFLEGCQIEVEAEAEIEAAHAAAPVSRACAARNGWVRERVEQCREWTAWQLRNFGRHERIEGEPPSMRIE